MPDVPLLSVVVPIYNVGSYLRPCLDSLLGQRVSDIEVVCVDDGSTDGSGEIADEYATRDARVRVVHVSNGGLGKARNIGVEHTRGRYLAFVDSDDRVTPDGYELMCASLERTRSDFATGAVNRFTDTRTWRSPLHNIAITRGARATHISKMTTLVNDTTAWNKVFRRRFWDAHEFRFPVGVLYEDIPVTIPAHVLAEKVDVIYRPVYEWRERGDGSMSITQRRAELKNLKDRLAAVESATEFLAEHATERVISAHDLKVLTVDIPLYLDVLDIADEEYREFFSTHMQQFLQHVDRQIFGQLPIWNRIAYELLARGRIDETVELFQVRKAAGRSYEVKRRGLGLYAQLPFLGDRAVGVPRSAYAVTNELPVRTAAESVEITGETVRIRGYALIDRVGLQHQWSAVRYLTVHNSKTGFRLARPVRPTRRPDLTASRGRPSAGYEWAGFEARVPLRRLPPGPDGRAAMYEVQVKVVTVGARRGVALAVDSAVRFDRRICVLADGTHVAVSGGDEFKIAVTQGAPVLRDVRIDAATQTLHCAVDLPVPVGLNTRMLWRSLHEDVPVVAARLTPDKSRPGRHTARFSLADFRMLGPGRERRSWRAVVDGDVTLDADEKPPGTQRSVVVPAELPAVRWEAPDRRHEFVVHATAAGRLELSDRRTGVQVTGFAWQDGELTLRMTMPVDLSDDVHVSLRHRDGADAFPEQVERRGTEVTARFRLLDLARTRSVTPGRWGLQVREGDFADDHFLSMEVTPECAAQAGGVVAADELAAEVRTADNRLWVRIRSGREDDRGAYHQERLQTGPYVHATQQPLRDTVLFQSWGGKQYSGSPRAVYEEMQRRGRDERCVWVRRNTAVEVPDGTASVLLGSREYYEALATSRYVVSNDLLPAYYRKRAGSVYVQTWHGTPLKRIGFDVATIHRDSPYLDELAADVPKWDHLVSASPYSTDRLRQALGFDGSVLEAGQPANDVFFADDLDERARAVRDRFGISPDQRVVLWAPTWRDDQRDGSGRYELPLPFDFATWDYLLGPDDVLLFRGHHLVEATVSNKLGGLRAVRNVTSYPDIQDLCLIADVLITDYSSVMVDFANTRRPMIFYAWDLDVFRDTVRGFYVDFEAEVPGPVVTDLPALREALAGGLGGEDARYERFVQKFCPLDDGHAAERVVKGMLG